MVATAVASGTNVAVYPNKDHLLCDAPSGASSVKIVFHKFRDLCACLRIPYDIREQSVAQCQWGPDGRINVMQVLGIVLEGKGGPLEGEQRKLIAVCAGVSKPTGSGCKILEQCPAIWSEGSWSNGMESVSS